MLVHVCVLYFVDNVCYNIDVDIHILSYMSMSPICSFSIVFPEEMAKVTCNTLEGKEKLVWNLVTAIMQVMNFDLLA